MQVCGTQAQHYVLFQMELGLDSKMYYTTILRLVKNKDEMKWFHWHGLWLLLSPLLLCNKIYFSSISIIFPYVIQD